jgi:hypothetical protein
VGEVNFHIIPTVHFNPNHDEKGRFASGRGTVTERSPYDCLTIYQSHGYSLMNSYLRGEKLSNPYMENQLKHDVSQIDKLFSSAKEQEVNVYRGDGAAISAHLFEKTGVLSEMGNTHLYRASDMLDKTPPGGHSSWESYFNSKMAGHTFEDKAFVSTSASKELALKKFVNPRDINGYGGQGLVSITGRSKSLNVENFTGVRGEQERLLPRGISFKIDKVELKVHQPSESFYFHYHVKVVK